MIHLELIFLYDVIHKWFILIFFSTWMSVAPALFVDKTVLSLIALSSEVSKCKSLFLNSQLTLDALNYVSVLMPVSHSLDCLISGKFQSSNFAFLFKIVLSVLGPLHFHMSFRIGL